MTTNKAAPERARTSGLVMAEEIARLEVELTGAVQNSKKAKATAERYETIAYSAATKVSDLRSRLGRRIRMFRELVEGDGLREDVAARWLFEERRSQHIKDAEQRATVPLSINQALPYAEQLLNSLKDEA